MNAEGKPLQSGNLPAVAPDLVVAQQPGGRWQVVRISPPLAAMVGISPEQAQGQELEGVFPRAVPPLGDLAREVLERDRDLGGIPVRFSPPDTPRLLADVSPSGLSPDYRSPLVAFRFRRPAQLAPVPERAAGGMVGASPGMWDVFRKIELYASTEAPVVITGETGTGKELVARALHDGSSRKREAFVAVNCSAITEELLESELFGHEKGAFTGAVRTHRGRFERADGGTLFLDEIGDMPFHTQAKLLRVLEEGRIERVGGEAEKPVDVRIVAATNVTLEKAVGQGRFRSDLYHRLSVLRIHIPPLRERPEDIPLLVAHFIEILNSRYGRKVHRLTPEALNLLQSYLWPGNVRELRNVLERVFVENQAEVIGARAFAEWTRERRDFVPGGWDLAAAEKRPATTLSPPYPLTSPQLLLESDSPLRFDPSHKGHSTRPADLDAEEIRRAFQAAGGNLAGAARLLGVHRATLYRYLQKLGLSRKDL